MAEAHRPSPPSLPPAINKMANSLLNFVFKFQVEAARRRLSPDKLFSYHYNSNVNKTRFLYFSHRFSESYVILSCKLNLPII